MLVYAINGGPLPPQHGYPLRLLVPGWYGMTSVKWLTSIEASTSRTTATSSPTPTGCATRSDEPGEALERMRPAP